MSVRASENVMSGGANESQGALKQLRRGGDLRGGSEGGPMAVPGTKTDTGKWPLCRAKPLLARVHRKASRGRRSNSYHRYGLGGRMWPADSRE